MRFRRRLALLATAIALASGCHLAGGSGATPSADIAASPPTATPEPLATSSTIRRSAAPPASATESSKPPAIGSPRPLGEGDPTASATGNGFLVDIWLDKTSVKPGDRITALVRVTNNGRQAPLWETDTCVDGPAPLTARATQPLPSGQSWAGVASKFKSQLLHEFGVASDGAPPLGKFIKADVIDSQYIVGCDLMSKIEPFKPGQVEEETLAWDVGAPRGVPLESGEIRLTATFAPEGFKLEAETGVTLEQGVPSGLTIVDYIDSALGNDEFEAWLSDHPPTTWISGMLAFWPTEQGGMPNFEPYTSAKNGAVDVGMFADSQGAGYGGVVLDPLTGAVLGTRFGNPDHHGTQPTATPAPY